MATRMQIVRGVYEIINDGKKWRGKKLPKNWREKFREKLGGGARSQAESIIYRYDDDWEIVSVKEAKE